MFVIITVYVSESVSVYGCNSLSSAQVARASQMALEQGWATLLASRATLEASKVYMGQYIYSEAEH